MRNKIIPAVLGQTVTSGIHVSSVKPACTNKHNGRWHCITHHETFENQFAKDTHIHTGEHVLCWLCYEHGFEVP